MPPAPPAVAASMGGRRLCSLRANALFLASATLLQLIRTCDAVNCASFCHWDIVNCQNVNACGSCDMCQGPDVQRQVADALAKAAAKNSQNGGQLCETWCNAAHSRSHCEDLRCTSCSFCAQIVSGSTTGCDTWCKKEHGHCTDSRCTGCEFCSQTRACRPHDDRDLKLESCENWCREAYKADHCLKCACKTCEFCGGLMAPAPRGAGTGAQAPVKTDVKLSHLVVTPPPVEKLECYALRYPDILSGFCHGDIGQCEWASIKSHWDSSGVAEGREIDCSGPDVQCYVLRYRDLLHGFCGGKLEKCPWKDILSHWAMHGHRNGLTFGCKSPDTICYAKKYQDLLQGYCHGNINRCDWVGLLSHWAASGEQEMRDFTCAPFPPPLLPPPPPPKRAKPSPLPPPPPVIQTMETREGQQPAAALGAPAFSSTSAVENTMRLDAQPGVQTGSRLGGMPSEQEGEALLSGPMLLILGATAIVGVACAFGAICVLRQSAAGLSHHEMISVHDQDDYDDDEYGEEYFGEEPEPEPKPRRKSKKSSSKRGKRHGIYE